jgi:hypothetical protein
MTIPNNTIYSSNIAKVNTQFFNDSRKTMTLTSDPTLLAGFMNPQPNADFITIAGYKSQTNQTRYTTYRVPSSKNISINKTAVGLSLMGFITYNAGPVKPTSLFITKISDGISITCQGDETQSLINKETIVGAVTQVMIFYSDSESGTYNRLENVGLISRNLVSGTTYKYECESTNNLKLVLGNTYFFKVATRNDVSIQYETDNFNSVAASNQSGFFQATYGDLLNSAYTRNNTNQWVGTTTKVRVDNGWVDTTIKKRNSTNTGWV